MVTVFTALECLERNSEHDAVFYADGVAFAVCSGAVVDLSFAVCSGAVVDLSFDVADDTADISVGAFNHTARIDAATAYRQNRTCIVCV